MTEDPDSREVTSEAGQLIRDIVREEFARSSREQREWLLRAGRGVAAPYVASLVVYLAAVFLSLMLVYILGALIEPWIGAALVGGLLLAGSFATVRRARGYFERVARNQ